GLGDQTFGPRHHNRKPLLGSKVFSTKRGVTVLIPPRRICLSLIGLIPCIATQVRYVAAHIWRQHHGCCYHVDGKLPCVAGYVPVKLIMIGEETELAISAIRKLVGVVAGRQVIAGTAKVNSNTVAQILSVVRLRVSV